MTRIKKIEWLVNAGEEIGYRRNSQNRLIVDWIKMDGQKMKFATTSSEQLEAAQLIDLIY